MVRRICVFNEKGGSGKTTVGLFLAGYLAYHLRMKVCVVDFDGPTFHFSSIRSHDLRLLQDPRSPLASWMRENAPDSVPYEVLRPSGPSDPAGVIRFVSSLQDRGYDCIIYDFPGALSAESAVSVLAVNGFIDFVAVPMDTDSQSRRSALVVADTFRSEGIPCCVFWNRVSLYESKGGPERFSRGAQPFVDRGIEVMPQMVREIRKFSRDADEFLFVRSTLCFPERYIRQWCPTLPEFLRSLWERMDTIGGRP